MNKVIAICSGGLDSMSMASVYANDDVTFLTFNYGQKGIKETEIVEKIANKLGKECKKIDISFVKQLYGNTNQLTSDEIQVEDSYATSVVVPLRNALFLQIAMVSAYSIGADIITLGSHSDDSSEVNGEKLYPDCSYEFFRAFEHAMDMGTFKKDKKVKVITPSILGLSKSELAKKGFEVLGDDLFTTWSCYKSGEKQCGKCESCNNRKSALSKAGIEDKTVYEV